MSDPRRPPFVHGFRVLDYDAKGVEWAIRLSPHYYNTEAEVDRVVEVLEELVDRRT